MKKIYNCYFEMVVDIIGGKWKPIILYCIFKNGVLRHSELKRVISNINERMLSRQLKELEEDGLIEKCIYPVVPLKVEYKLSELGEKVIPILEKILEWGELYIENKKDIDFSMDIKKERG